MLHHPHLHKTPPSLGFYPSLTPLRSTITTTQVARPLPPPLPHANTFPYQPAAPERESESLLAAPASRSIMGRQRQRQRRFWSRTAVVACLLVLLGTACAETSRPLAGRRLLAAAPWEEPAGGVTETASEEGPRGSAFDVLVEALVSIGLGRRWRAGGHPLVDDDKRRVPTGPNPLHNR